MREELEKIYKTSFSTDIFAANFRGEFFEGWLPVLRDSATDLVYQCRSTNLFACLGVLLHRCGGRVR